MGTKPRGEGRLASPPRTRLGTDAGRGSRVVPASASGIRTPARFSTPRLSRRTDAGCPRSMPSWPRRTRGPTRYGWSGHASSGRPSSTSWPPRPGSVDAAAVPAPSGNEPVSPFVRRSSRPSTASTGSTPRSPGCCATRCTPALPAATTLTRAARSAGSPANPAPPTSIRSRAGRRADRKKSRVRPVVEQLSRAGELVRDARSR